MKKILVSLAVIGAAGAIVAGATGAFFSDTETSTGNTFTAGAIDLTIDNESYAIDYTIPDFEGTPNGSLVASPGNTWDLVDLTIQKFFNFTDLKPGDFGEDTISIHVNNNDSWVCAAVQITADNDVDYTEPELDDDQTVVLNDPTGTDGELDSELQFAFWADDGDNVLESDEVETIFVAGTLSNMGQTGQIALADVNGNVWDAQGGPVSGGDVLYIGKAWCFGNLTSDPVAQDDLGKVGTPENPQDIPNNPLVRGTGIACDGTNVDNASQTDIVVGDLQFFAVQSRNNTSFDCKINYQPDWSL
ncbi:hypothetical protein IID24_02265 [Patescibacteria group bacterium]|nr:hypothetical protein [Patescibacteria group bacterium]